MKFTKVPNMYPDVWLHGDEEVLFCGEKYPIYIHFPTGHPSGKHDFLLGIRSYSCVGECRVATETIKLPKNNKRFGYK